MRRPASACPPRSPGAARCVRSRLGSRSAITRRSARARAARPPSRSCPRRRRLEGPGRPERPQVQRLQCPAVVREERQVSHDRHRALDPPVRVRRVAEPLGYRREGDAGAAAVTRTTRKRLRPLGTVPSLETRSSSTPGILVSMNDARGFRWWVRALPCQYPTPAARRRPTWQ